MGKHLKLEDELVPRPQQGTMLQKAFFRVHANSCLSVHFRRSGNNCFEFLFVLRFPRGCFNNSQGSVVASWASDIWPVLIAPTSILLPCTIGALIIRIGFWGPLYFITIRNLQNGIGNYLGPCSRCLRMRMPR